MICPATGSDQADEWVRLGVDSQLAGQLPQAQQRYQQALRIDPRHVIATQNLAIVFAQSPGFLNEGLLTIERAEMIDPNHTVTRMNHALMAVESERIDEALVAARKAVELDPASVPCLMALASVLTTAGMAGEAMPIYNLILDKEPKHPQAGPNSCFIQTLTNATPADLLAQRKRWYSANRWEGKPAKHNNSKETDRPLRIGYVGGDFKSHSAAFIFSHVLFHHTPAVEMYLYSSLAVDPVADSMSKKFQEMAGDRWRDISTVSDEDADALIRKDKIDILVDLAGHTNGGRLALFTRKTAPVQATAWGFAHGTGLPEIDYFMADPIAVPEAERKDYAEKIVDLPCLVTFEDMANGLKGTSAPPIKKNGYFTFGAYARFEKFSDECLKTFAEILRQVPDSKLELKDGAYRRPYSIRRVLNLMPDIDPSRLLFSIGTTHQDHLLSYQQADFVLDPWPHGGGVVSLEQIFMGVPVLTLYGTQPSGRNTSSMLAAMGRSEWIAYTPAEYVAKAVEWSERTKDLAKARTTLREELLKSPVVVGYVEAVEAAYQIMFRKWCES